MRGVLFSFCYDGSLRWSESLSLFQLMGEFTRSIPWGDFSEIFHLWFATAKCLVSEGAVSDLFL